MLWQDRLRTLPEQVELNTNNIAELGNDLNITNGTVTKVINDLTATNLKVNNNTDKIAVNARDIEQNRLVISGVAGKVETNITNIATNKNNITSINNVLPTKADKTTVEGIDTRVSSIEYREGWKYERINGVIENSQIKIIFPKEWNEYIFAGSYKTQSSGVITTYNVFSVGVYTTQIDKIILYSDIEKIIHPRIQVTNKFNIYIRTADPISDAGQFSFFYR